VHDALPLFWQAGCLEIFFVACYLLWYILNSIANIQQTENYGDSAELKKLEIAEKPALKILFQGLYHYSMLPLCTLADYLPIFSRQAYPSFRLHILLL
jgi:hypothetical protein